LQFFSYLAVIAAIILIARVPFSHVLKRSLVIIPFVVLIAIFIPFFKKGEVAGGYNLGLIRLTITYSGLWVLWNILIKSWLSVLSIITLSSTTKFPDLLKGLEQLKMPKVMVMLLSFMYRYLFVLVDEVERYRRARDSRFFGGQYLQQIRVLGNIIGVLFIRTYERGERVYTAMVSRGFDGKIKTLTRSKITKWDVAFLFSFITYLTVVKVLVI